jgi:hypothetical protein
VEKTEGKTPLVRPKYRQYDNIKMHLKEIECEYADWPQLAQNTAKW